MLVTVAAYPDRVVIEVSDCGCGFEVADDEELPETGAFAERGRGIRLMRLLVDSVSISLKRTGEGTVVRLVKLVPTRGAGGGVRRTLHLHDFFICVRNEACAAVARPV